MNVIQEFRKFIARGNVIDLAVGVMVGGAFGKIVSSFVSDILTPPLSIILGNVELKEYRVVLQEASSSTAAVTLNYGQFIETAFDFFIIAAAIFLFVKLYNRIPKQEKREQVPPPPPPPEEIVLLREIRDVLKK